MTVKRYRKLLVSIYAIQWIGTNYSEIINFTSPIDTHIELKLDTYSIIIPTLEGDIAASVGDWIIKGVCGEFYPCKPNIFLKTYEEIDGDL